MLQAQRWNFFNTVPNYDESTSDYVNRLVNLAVECDFEHFTVKAAILHNLLTHSSLPSLRQTVLNQDLDLDDTLKYAHFLECDNPCADDFVSVKIEIDDDDCCIKQDEEEEEESNEKDAPLEEKESLFETYSLKYMDSASISEEKGISPNEGSKKYSEPKPTLPSVIFKRNEDGLAYFSPPQQVLVGSETVKQNSTQEKPYKSYSAESMNSAILAVRNGMSNRDASKKFLVPRSTLQRAIMKSKETIREQGHSYSSEEYSQNYCEKRAGRPFLLSTVDEAEIVDKISTLVASGHGWNRKDMKRIVKQVLTERREKEGVSGLQPVRPPSDNWCRQFEQRWSSQLPRRLCPNDFMPKRPEYII